MINYRNGSQIHGGMLLNHSGQGFNDIVREIWKGGQKVHENLMYMHMISRMICDYVNVNDSAPLYWPSPSALPQIRLRYRGLQVGPQPDSGVTNNNVNVYGSQLVQPQTFPGYSHRLPTSSSSDQANLFSSNQQIAETISDDQYAVGVDIMDRTSPFRYMRPILILEGWRDKNNAQKTRVVARPGATGAANYVDTLPMYEGFTNNGIGQATPTFGALWVGVTPNDEIGKYRPRITLSGDSGYSNKGLICVYGIPFEVRNDTSDVIGVFDRWTNFGMTLEGYMGVPPNSTRRFWMGLSEPRRRSESGDSGAAHTLSFQWAGSRTLSIPSHFPPEGSSLLDDRYGWWNYNMAGMSATIKFNGVHATPTNSNALTNVPQFRIY